ncbi:HTH domain-containing protein [Candidatus Woesearchaeota archaeon]|nr:HTH domain-containing protein [Candidatus Woesearchaeota archaeon]
MNKTELVYRELLYWSLEKQTNEFTQAALAKKLHISLSTVNSAVTLLESMGALEIKQRSFHLLDRKKILYYWASIRNLQKDIIYTTRVEKSVIAIEKAMPNDIIFGAYTAYKFLYHDVPADYSEVYVYGDEYLKKRFPLQKGVPNLFVLKKDPFMESHGKTTTVAQTFVDLWNLRDWYAKEFIVAMEKRLHGILE